MDLLTKFGTDPESVADGVWVPLERGPGGEVLSQVKIARHNNRAYRQHISEQVIGRELKNGQAEEIQIDAFAKHILKGWDGIELDGEPLEFTPENVMRVCTDPRLVDFRDWVTNQSMNMDLFRLKQEEEDAGKS